MCTLNCSYILIYLVLFENKQTLYLIILSNDIRKTEQTRAILEHSITSYVVKCSNFELSTEKNM